MDSALRAFVDHQQLRNLRRGTITRRTYVLQRLATRIEPTPLVAASPGDLEAWLDSCSLSPASRNTYISHLRAFYGWAHDVGLVLENPTKKLHLARLPRRLPRPAALPDYQAAVETAEPMMRAWLLLAGLAGLRCHEIARVRRQDVRDRDQPPTLLVADGKGGHERVVPLHPAALAALRPFLHRGRGWLFEKQGGGRYRAGTVSVYVARHFHTHGFEWSAHNLRHWFGSNVYQLSHDLRVTQELMGHADPKTTTIYTLIDTTTSAPVVDSLPWRQ